MLDQLTFWSEEPHAKASPSPDSARDSTTHAETSCLSFLQSLNVCGLDGLSGKTSPVSCRRREGVILEPSSGRWGNWGTGGPIGCWTLSGSEHNGIHAPSRSAGDVCSLSDVLDTSTVPQRYYLSAKACAGILRRAERRGKELPAQLQAALEQAAGGMREPEKAEGKIASSPCLPVQGRQGRDSGLTTE